MTNVIHVLPLHEALKIAAGEVIERPAHILKELVENSLDAGATTVTVYAEDVGKKVLRIVDNGCGMSPDDVQLCFLTHATSKISTIDDLEAIGTYGFRGEALASISAVSKVILTSKQQGQSADELGLSIEYTEGRMVSQAPVACTAGTEIVVKDLFFNMPVRKKFLKQDDTEWNALQSVFHSFCFSHPHVHFRLYHNDKLILNAPATAQLKDRALQVWDYDLASSMLPITAHQEGTTTITGLITPHTIWRYGRHNIYFFVNNRWVRNIELSRALMKGYTNVLPPDRFPAALLFVQMDQRSLDVNIHPKKEEIRFIKPGVIQSLVTSTVKQTLEANVSCSIARSQSEPARITTSWAPHTITSTNFYTSSTYTTAHNMQPATINTPRFQYPTEQLQETTSLPPCQSPTHRIIGQLFNTYIVIEKETEIVFIDQHAAHERILYEKFKKNFGKQHGTQLLFPEMITLSHTQLSLISSIQTVLADQGIELECMGDDHVIIRSTPPEIKSADLKDFILQTLAFLEEHNGNQVDLPTKINEHIHASMACKGAIKAGDVLTQFQMQKLIDDLQAAENRLICVHGRPTIWTVSKAEFEKKFKRS